MVGVALVQVITTSGHAAETASAEERPQSGQKIQITADELISSGQDNYAEFIGNVEVIQGTFLIKSDRLRIYYKSFKGDSKTLLLGEESIEKIIATGNVRIWSDDRRAETDQAEYSPVDMVLVLSGENSTVTSGKNSVTGSKITLYRRDGRIKVEGSSGKRVKAIFHQGEQAESESAGEKP
jgi:lipopolysaccharide export system protein LptA